MSLTHLDARAQLIDALREDLIGPMLPDELLLSRPTLWYLTGFIVPKGASEELIGDPLDDEELSAGLDGEGDDDAGGRDGGAARRGWYPSSIGLTALVPPSASALRVTLRWGEYRPLEGEEAEAARSRWESPRVALDAARADDEAPSEDTTPSARRPVWARVAREAAEIALPLTPTRRGVPGAPGLVLQVQVAPTRAPGLPAGARAVSVFVVNERDLSSGAAGEQGVMFQAQLTVTCAEGFIPRMDWSDNDAPDDDAARADLQYRAYGEWAVGHGVATETLARDGETVTTIGTTWLPLADVRRMKAGATGGATLSMEALASAPDAEALSALMAPMLDAYAGWLAQRHADADALTGGRLDTAKTLLARAEGARARIAEGLQTLKDDPLAFEAFQITNAAMAAAARKARPNDAPRWRLFQLAFLLLNVPSAGAPGHVDREVVELLFFPTGGGKTEAYLGVAAYVMALRRLQGRGRPDEGAGVAVLLRYTLRLLTLDQLGRAAALICALELLRRERPARLGAHRFSVGLWVGRSGTANKLADAEKALSLWRSNPNDPRRSPGVPLVGCPWCGAQFMPECYRIDRRGREPIALRVGCANGDCEFHYDHSEDLGVPLAVVDEQVYRELPTFLLATVDKLAVLPWRGQAGTLFGRVGGADADGFYAVGERLPKGARSLSALRPPELIIQDELHLITGPLGTMVGLYETVIDQLARDAQGHGPKLIASTATARRATAQIQALYGRATVELFPPPGLDPSDSFFAETDLRPEAARRYVGVSAPGRSMKAVAVRVYSTLLSAAYKLWRRGAGGAENPADTYSTLVAYFNTLRELGGAARLVQEEVAPRCARLERRRALQQDRSARCADRTLGFDTLELTSRQSTDDIRKATARLRAPYQSPLGGRNDVLLASSMISVGVDIPRLGLMVMNGQPRTVAEYIQATSRVGRETPGLVVTIYNPRRPRDRSHYERFRAFHEGFYRLVEAATVTPFSSRAIDRGLAGVVVALARHGWRALTPPKALDRLDATPGVREGVGDILARRLLAATPDADEAEAAHLRSRAEELLTQWSRVVKDMTSVGAPMVYSPWEVSGGTALLSTAVDPQNNRPKALEMFRAPTSMRDVEPGVPLWLMEGAMSVEER